MDNPGIITLIQWSIYRWLEGETTEKGFITNSRKFAIILADFLKALESIDSTNGPLLGAHNFYRGGSLKVYNPEMQRAIHRLGKK